MKRYYTLAQYNVGAGDRLIYEYLREQNIPFTMGGNFADEMESAIPQSAIGKFDPNQLVIYLVLLLEEAELSAISLALPNVVVLKNSRRVEAQNIVEGMFKWRI
jgi:hypothetical protein